VDGIPHGEAWRRNVSGLLLLDGGQLRLQGRHEDAVQMFERRLDIRNDVGLLSEEYDPIEKHQVGNFPQAFSHVGLVNTAFNLSSGSGRPPAAAPRVRRIQREPSDLWLNNLGRRRMNLLVLDRRSVPTPA
jgi:hypothetical protein